MVTLVLISIPITFLNVLNEVAALRLLHGDSSLGVVTGAQREALALLFLNLHGDGASLANIFWGFWLFPFGALVMRSGFIPRILGVLLILNGVALIVVSLTALMFPAHLDSVSRYAIIPELGELWMMGWLLIKGVRPLRTSFKIRGITWLMRLRPPVASGGIIGAISLDNYELSPCFSLVERLFLTPGKVACRYVGYELTDLAWQLGSLSVSAYGCVIEEVSRNY